MTKMPVSGPERAGLGSLIKYRPRGGTFDAIKLDCKALGGQADFNAFLDSLLGSVIAVRDDRLNYYAWQRGRRAFVNVARRALVMLGVVALVSSALSAAIRLVGAQGSTWLDRSNWLLGLALVCYVLMSALSFWETATAATASYFRQIQLILGIRDLWTQFEFDLVKALRDKEVGAVDEQPTRTAVLELARALVAAIDALARGELDQWKLEFQTSVTTLQTVGRDGLEQIKAEIKSRVDDALEKSKMGYVALTVSGAVAPIDVTLDDKPPFTSDIIGFTLPPLAPAVYRLRLKAKDAAGKSLEVNSYLQVAAGISSHGVAMDTGVITSH